MHHTAGVYAKIYTNKLLYAGVLGGLVAITGGCNQLRPWEGLVIGFIGGLIAVGGKLKFVTLLCDFFPTVFFFVIYLSTVKNNVSF